MTALVPTKSQLAERKSIHDLQDFMLALPKDEQIDVDSMTSHFFAPGVYARKYFIPKESIVIGKIHKTEHLNIICKGKCSVSTEDGPMIFEGPCIFTSRPGVKKAVYAYEDTTWITIHVTTETDIDKIEDEVIAKDYAEIEHKE